MLVYASWITARRAPEVRRLFGLALVALTAALTVSLGVVFGLGVFRLTSRTLVPTAGLIVGNALTSTVVVARRTVDDLRDKRAEVEARLALGLPSEQAARPHIRSALRTALSPQIERTRAVGQVALPGAMTGLLLAGVDPLSPSRRDVPRPRLGGRRRSRPRPRPPAPPLHPRPPAAPPAPPGRRPLNPDRQHEPRPTPASMPGQPQPLENARPRGGHELRMRMVLTLIGVGD